MTFKKLSKLFLFIGCLILLFTPITYCQDQDDLQIADGVDNDDDDDNIDSPFGLADLFGDDDFVPIPFAFPLTIAGLW